MSSRIIAKSPTGYSQVATGTYTGDGAATQAIVGVGFQPRFVIVYAQVDGANRNLGLKSNQEGVNTKLYDRIADSIRYLADMIISLDADGFTVGDGTGLANVFNIAAIVYTYVAFRA